MKIIFKEDSRDKVFKNMFGQVVTLPEEYNADSTLYDDVQPIGDVKCTCYTVCDIAEDQDNVEYDILDLWNRIISNPTGAEPREPLSQAVNVGLLPKGKTERVKRWNSYWRADIGLKDPFDNVRSALYMAQSPVGVATYWYDNWVNETVLTLGKNPLNGHMYSAEGWKLIGGIPHLIIEAWIGRKVFMNRQVFNQAMKPFGMQSWVLSTSDIDTKRKRTILELIRDTCLNVIIKLKELIVLKEQEVPIVKQETKNDILYKTALRLLNTDASPKDMVDDDVACVDTLNNVYKTAFGTEISRNVVSTIALYDILVKDKRFYRTTEPIKGTIILCVTGTGNGKMLGHVGIQGIHKIISNDSTTGLLKDRYSYQTWYNRYVKLGGFKMHFFNLI